MPRTRRTRPGRLTRTTVRRVDERSSRLAGDVLATEEPLEIRLLAGGEQASIAVTMRTPGEDFELAAGFLFSEGLVASRDEIVDIGYCLDGRQDQLYNSLRVRLRRGSLPELSMLERSGFVSSACGICGRVSLEGLERRGLESVETELRVSEEVLLSLPSVLEGAQEVFARTGGLHAAALFDVQGELLVLREDIGRHNALDKLLGWALLEDRLPLGDRLLLLSGRAGFELVQKALVARIPVVCAVSAPSSLAVQLAERFGVTLVGFLRAGRFNIYAHGGRIAVGPRASSSSIDILSPRS